MFESTTIFDKELNPVNGVIRVKYSGTSYDIFEMKIIGISDEYKTAELYLCAYAIIDGEVVYFNNGIESNEATAYTYNDIVLEEE